MLLSGKKMLLIQNPRAGSHKSQSAFFEAASLLFKSGCSVYLYSTQSSGDAARVAAQRASDFDIVVCFGGDGTMNEVINGLMQLERRPLLGYIPAGTTNDFAAALGLSKNISEAALQLLDSEPVPIDVGSFNAIRHFAYVASFGSFTKASYSAPQDIKNAIGYTAYLLEGLKNITDIHPYSLTVHTDQQCFQGDFIFGGVSNSTSMGGIIKLNSSQVDLSDALFELMLIRNPKSILHLQKILYSLATRNYSDNDQIVFTKSANITFHCDNSFAWTVDGEFGGVCGEAVITNCHNALSILKPRREI